jgi:hypothetical protein
MVLATARDGQPDVALKGSMYVWDRDHLAYWERSFLETEAALRSNPRVAVLFRKPGEPPLRFYGEARFVADDELRERIWARVNAEEQGRDPERRGQPVLIRVDRVRRGREDIQHR